MNQTLSFPKKIAIPAIPLLIIGFLYALVNSSAFSAHANTLSIGITADLLIILPIVYSFLIRKSKIPKTTVIPVMVIGIVICSVLLPAQNQFYLNQFKYWVLPFIELTILGFVIYKVRMGIKTYKSLAVESTDFYSQLKMVCSEILPSKAVMPFVTEIAMFYYGFINWRKADLKSNQFTYHESTGSVALFGAFIFVIGIETFAFHLLLIESFPLFAWIMTGHSLYTALQILAVAKSLSRRPIEITSDALRLRYGILNEVTIPFEEINTVEYSKRELEKAQHIKSLSPIGQMEGHNMILTVKNPQVLVGIYGLKKSFSTLLFTIDEPQKFNAALSNYLNRNNEEDKKNM